MHALIVEEIAAIKEYLRKAFINARVGDDLMGGTTCDDLAVTICRADMTMVDVCRENLDSHSGLLGILTETQWHALIANNSMFVHNHSFEHVFDAVELTQ